MASIKLKNIRTGEAKNYPLALLDASVLRDKVALDGWALSANCAAVDPFYSSRPAAQLKIFRADTGNAYDYLQDLIAPTSADNLLYIPPTQPLADYFEPVLAESGITYGTPPAEYAANNPYGVFWQDAGAQIDGANMVFPSSSFDLTKSYRKSYTLQATFETSNRTMFGLSAGFCGAAPLSVGIVANCGKQITYSRDAESNSFPNYVGDAWSLSSSSGPLLSLPNPYERIGAWQSYAADSSADSVLPPTENISTQFVYSEVDGVPYVGLAVILWSPDEFGVSRASHIRATLYPLWLLGGVSGEFTPDVPEVDEIPVDTTGISNGTWTITQAPAGAASIPAVSPLAGIGINDPGMHILIADADAINAISDRAWNSISQSVLESFTSGLVSCGFVPYEFIRQIMVPANAVPACSIGKVRVKMPSDGVDHLWLANAQLWTTIQGGSFSTSLRKVYANYLDYEPHTTVSLEIPFCGEVPIPASACIGGAIDVVLNCNITTGDICATITCTSSPDIVAGTAAPGVPLVRTFFAYGNAFCPMPIVGTNSGLSQFMTGLSETVAGIAQMAGGKAGGAGSIVSGLIGMGQAPIQPVRGGSPVGSKAIIGNKRVLLKITRPAPSYTHINEGYQPYRLEKRAKLRDLRQTVNPDWLIAGRWDRVTVREIELTDGQITEQEAVKITELLSRGVLI